MSLEESIIKRARVPNFTVEEKTILIKLVNKRKEIIECKYTDTKSIMKKKEAWMLIEKEFNSEINVYKRDHTVLKRAWDNLKAQTRKMRASKGDNHSKSGGSSPVQPSLAQEQTVINMVVEPLPTLSGEVDNDFDSDGIVYKDMSMEQSDPLTSSAQGSGLEFEPNDSSHIKFEDSNDESYENLHPHTMRNNDFIHREADLRLKSLQIKNKLEQQILKTKLQTALLHQQQAEISLEAAKLELAFQKKRMKD